MKPVHVCVPVLKRYDLLRELMLSLVESFVHPATIYVIDNGNQPGLVREAAIETKMPTEIVTPTSPLGVAEAWNWFIKNVPEERLIVNDDIRFGRESIGAMVVKEGDFVSALAGSNACSCFILRDSCVDRVGLFDELISPGYAYFEDCDYIERMIMQGIPITGVECGVLHGGSQTLAANTSQEMARHNERFMIAQTNFIAKWGRTPNVPGPHWPRPAEVA